LKSHLLNVVSCRATSTMGPRHTKVVGIALFAGIGYT
jgi:hypothetical protein